MEVNYSLSYSARDENTRNTILDLTASFETEDKEVLMKNLNTWLTAINSGLQVSDVN